MVENLGVLEKTLWSESHRGEVSAQSSLVVAKSLKDKVQVIMEQTWIQQPSGFNDQGLTTKT